ncbi:hypothetical protein PNQ29_11695 [Halobacterium salinarum]|uniref:hypothetical protein n=1 Tax=Halobacterium salinarum TaxID=2242 RepID=UPI002554D841|nr:hypothetical protein [Halobacterium salinarum]MDL0120382.1 hypothetical protein [Halobacterium salinarum]
MYDIQNARRRDGDAAEDRSERVDEILNRPRLGYEEGDPLPESFKDYGGYPEQPNDLTTPDARQFVTELFASPLVTSIDDAIEETTPVANNRLIRREWREAFHRAVELFGGESLDGDDERDENDADSRLAELTGDYPDDMVTPSNPLVVSALYAGHGLSSEEITEVFSDDSDRQVESDEIRATLRNAGLITATESTDSEPSHKLGGTTISFRDGGNTGVNIDSEAIARDPTISVERADK